MNLELRDCLVSLHLNRTAEQIRHSEQDILDQKGDMAEFKEQLGEMIATQERRLTEFKGESEQRDFLRTLLSTSVKFHLKNIGGSDSEAKWPIAPQDFIAFLELDFHDFIAQGNMSQVFRGRWKDRPVAIKLLRTSLSQIEGKEFCREVSVMSRLRNEHVVTFYGACLEEGHACLVMELLDNASLYEQIGKKAFTLVQRKQIALDIAGGLHYLHSQECVHRDLRSENILLTNEKRAKIADFGLAKTRADSLRSLGKVNLGIPWCAPELLASGRQITAKADIYSLGMILWELFTDRRPFPKRSAGELTQAILSGQRETLDDDIAPEWRSLIAACWSPDPAKRPELPDILEQLERYDPVEACYRRAKALEEAKSLPAAREHYQMAADSGSIRALTSLGIFSLRGLGGLPLDKPEAYRLFLSAAQKGHPRAMKNAAIMLDTGDGIVQDQKQALVWYEKAGDPASLERAKRLKEKLAPPAPGAGVAPA